MTSSQKSGAWRKNLSNMQVISLRISASDLPYLLPCWPPPRERTWRQNLSNMQVMSLWTSDSDLPYLLPWWPPPKGAVHGISTSLKCRWCQIQTSTSYLPYLLPWWPPPKGAGRGGRTSPTSRWCQWWTSPRSPCSLRPLCCNVIRCPNDTMILFWLDDHKAMFLNIRNLEKAEQ